MSFTNLSMVPMEMLACGTIPVVNESSYARLDLTNEHVVWSHPTPDAMAEELSKVISNPRRAEIALSAAASVTGGNWDDAKRVVVEAVEREAYG